MIRFLYGQLLRMHPPTFRKRFSGEMLLIFDEAVRSEGCFSLLFDCLASLIRQWFLRSGVWKLIPAISCALLQFMTVAFRLPLPPTASGTVPSSGDASISLAELVTTAAVITLMLIAATALGVWNVRRLVGGLGANMVSSRCQCKNFQ